MRVMVHIHAPERNELQESADELSKLSTDPCFYAHEGRPGQNFCLLRTRLHRLGCAHSEDFIIRAAIGRMQRVGILDVQEAQKMRNILDDIDFQNGDLDTNASIELSGAREISESTKDGQLDVIGKKMEIVLRLLELMKLHGCIPQNA